MKTHVKVAAATVAAAGLLAAAGCSSSSSAGSGSGGGVVKLSVLTGFTGPDGPSYQALVSQFNASHPTIKVTMDIQPWDAIGQKLPSEWATGQGPDLATPNFDPGVDLHLHQDQLGPAADSARRHRRHPDQLQRVPLRR